jgi:hypothetical protein
MWLRMLAGVVVSLVKTRVIIGTERIAIERHLP